MDRLVPEVEVVPDLKRRVVPHRVFRRVMRELTSREGATACSIPLIVGASTTVGLLAGMLEVLARLAWTRIDTRVTQYESALNWHWPWMAPLAVGSVFGIVGLLLGLLGQISPRHINGLAVRVWATLTVFSLSLSARGVDPFALLLLAAGMGTCVGWVLYLNRSRLSWMACRLLPGALGLELLLMAVVGGRVAFSEAGHQASLPAARPGAPNVLLIVLDTVRAKNLSLYGYARETTPNLRKLASKGVWFQNARSPANWTLPSHASMFTGKLPHSLSAGPDQPLDATHPTLAEALRDRGYRTAGFSANLHYANTAFGLGRGFGRFEDHWHNQRVLPAEVVRSSRLGALVLDCLSQLGLKGCKVKLTPKRAEAINDRLLSWLEEGTTRSDRRPFFAFLNYMDAHGPYVLPKQYTVLSPVDQKEIAKLRARVQAFRAQQPDLLGAGGRVGGLHIRPDDPDEIKQALEVIADAQTTAYDNCIEYIDLQIGILMGQLEQRGLLDSTLVVITSDHGEHFGEHGAFGHGTTLYRELTHIPLIIFGPGVPNRGELTAVVSTRQLPSTLCELTGAGNSSFEGPSLTSSWHGDQSAEPGREVLIEVEHLRHIPPSPHFRPSTGPMWAVVKGTHTYIHGGPDGEELFDSESDPEELNDLADDPAYSGTLEQLRSSLIESLQDCRTPGYSEGVRRLRESMLAP
jgi:arylsulfatase A-like enzyme